jgi:hypothetical protein
MDEVFFRMGDRDGNFREQFQTSGFDARVWELYLFAALEEAGFKIDQPDPAPDFLLTRAELRWALEATTANLRHREGPPQIGSKEELLAFLNHELPIRLGSPLFSKLKANYPGREELAEFPFVLGLECFVSPSSMFFSEAPLGSYLYGLQSIPEYDKDGRLRVHHAPITEHRLGEKVIPSGFFKQAGAEQISAILFSNSGTVAKFDRMGYQQGIANDRLWMGRYGFRADEDPNASSPLFFIEEVGAHKERWTDGLVLFHNPNARQPLPDDALDEVTLSYAYKGKQIRHTNAPHVFSSQTLTVPAPRGHGVETARLIGRYQLGRLAEQMTAQPRG